MIQTSFFSMSECPGFPSGAVFRGMGQTPFCIRLLGPSSYLGWMIRSVNLSSFVYLVPVTKIIGMVIGFSSFRVGMRHNKTAFPRLTTFDNDEPVEGGNLIIPLPVF